MIMVPPDAAEAVDLKAIEASLEPLSTDDIQLRFRTCLKGATAFIAEAAVCVKILKQRGVELSDIPMTRTYLRIANGTILPELVSLFLESPNRVYAERLPVEDQRRLVANPMVPVVEPKAGGGHDIRMTNSVTTPREVAQLVLTPDGILTPDQQKVKLGAQSLRAAVKRTPRRAEEPLSRSVTVKLTESEYRALRMTAAAEGVSESAAVRMILARCNAFKAAKP